MTEITKKEIYEQQYAHFGRMNNLLYQMPPIFSTILGGLWYFGASYLGKDNVVAVGVFGFAALAACCFTIALRRFRLAFNAYIDNINKLDGDYKVSIQNSCWPSTIDAMTVLVAVAAIISIAGSVYAGMGWAPSEP